MGHIYPGTFLFLLAWSWKLPRYRKQECWGMVVFWLLYWIIDLIQHRGVDFSDLKIMQHHAFTMFVGMTGLFRLLPWNKDLDSFAMFALVMGFGIFVAMHPQPNSIGVWMHLITSAWLFMFWPAYVLKAENEGTVSLIMAATSFISSQLALTTAASNVMDVVAYFSIVSVVGLGVVSAFQLLKMTSAQTKLPVTDDKK